jgi:hypothetical protein
MNLQLEGSDEGTVLGRTTELLVHLNRNLLKLHRNVTKEYEASML